MFGDIDIVITWVDNKDPCWISEYKKYARYKDTVRFEELGTLKYVFRGIDSFMPWVRKIFFVTFGHHPSWLNLNHSKLNLVKHSDIFPNKQDLPTFNSSAIEMNFHHIKGLSEKFIYFNDDTFIIKKVNSDYFFSDNLPNDFFTISCLFHDNIFSHLLHSDMQIINKEVMRDKSFIKQLQKTFSPKYGFKTMLKSAMLLMLCKNIPLFALHHHPQPHLKSNFEEVEEKYRDIMDKTRAARFRSSNEINQYVFRFWGLIKGKFNTKLYSDVLYVGVKNIDELRGTMEKINIKDTTLVCFNEESDFSKDDYERYKTILINFLEEILPNKSLFELR